MNALLLYSLLSTSCFFLGARAMITSAIWSRYPNAFGRFMDCSACTGFWYGLIAAATLGTRQGLDFFGLASDSPITWILVGLCTIVTTPMVAGLMQQALYAVGVSVGTAETPDEMIDRLEGLIKNKLGDTKEPDGPDHD